MEPSACMELAFAEAKLALKESEVPVGCVFVDKDSGEVVARGHNETNATKNATRHAELVAIDAHLAGGGSLEAFSNCTLFVTVEPCIMCASALSVVGIHDVVYGCGNDKFGGNGSVYSFHTAEHFPDDPTYHTYTSTGGLMADEAVELLRKFYSVGNIRAPRPQRALVPSDDPPEKK